MKIVQAPHPVLAQHAKPVKTVTKAILKLIEEMKQTLLFAHDPEGVGLAAPQIGKSLQLFIMKPSKNDPFSVFMNPHISVMKPKEKIQKQQSEKTKKDDDTLEGCLSLKEIWGSVQRAQSVTITYIDEQGKQQAKTITGFPATIIQHEYDHLHGILFPKRVLEQKGTLYKSKKGKDGKDVFEEIHI